MITAHDALSRALQARKIAQEEERQRVQDAANELALRKQELQEALPAIYLFAANEIENAADKGNISCRIVLNTSRFDDLMMLIIDAIVRTFTNLGYKVTNSSIENRFIDLDWSETTRIIDNRAPSPPITGR